MSDFSPLMEWTFQRFSYISWTGFWKKRTLIRSNRLLSFEASDDLDINLVSFQCLHGSTSAKREPLAANASFFMHAQEVKGVWKSSHCI